MPIREYHGMTGIRLIAEEPTKPTEIATIHTEQMVIRAIYCGNKSNGYPALSPAPFSLPVVILQRIEDERAALLNAIAESEMAYRPVSVELRSLLDEGVANIQNIVPTLSSIMKGRTLQLILPSRFQTPRYNLGTVQRYEIAPLPRPR